MLRAALNTEHLQADAQAREWLSRHGEGQRKGAIPSLDEALDDRIAGLAAWILEHAPHVAAEQEHLDEGTQESAYWHYGYLTALLDVRESLARRRSSSH